MTSLNDARRRSRILGTHPPLAKSLSLTRVPMILLTSILWWMAASASVRSEPVVVQDDAGQRLSLAHTPTRIVSLTPGATEMLFAAGAGDSLVATVEYSDEPPAAKRVPRIGDVTAVDMER